MLAWITPKAYELHSGAELKEQDLEAMSRPSLMLQNALSCSITHLDGRVLDADAHRALDADAQQFILVNLNQAILPPITTLTKMVAEQLGHE